MTHAAFITGSSRGIGLAAAEALAGKGFAIALNGPADDDELQAATARIAVLGVPVAAIAGDVADTAGHAAMLDAAEAAIGPLSTLVNNAGVSVLSRGDPLEATEESFDRCMAINARAQFFLTQAFARRLVARERDDGRFYSVVSVTSSNAVAVAENRAEYCASKAAASMIARTFAVRLGREGIAVYDIQPGVIETAMTAPARDAYAERIAGGLTLLPRAGQPGDVGGIIAMLASGGLPYTTGHAISVDGGMLVPRF